MSFLRIFFRIHSLNLEMSQPKFHFSGMALLLLALTLFTTFLGTQGDSSWNTFLKASDDGHIFPVEMDMIETKADMLEQLRDILNNHDTLNAIYTNYKARYQMKHVAKLDQSGREQVFANNLLRIAKHNMAFHDGQETWTMGITPFTDMTIEEREEGYPRMQMSDPIPIVNESNEDSEIQLKAAPNSWDWRSKNIVTPAKDQNDNSKGRKCGTCSVFTAMAVVEGCWARNTNYKQLKSFSEQEVMDCGGVSCAGDYMDKTFDYVLKNGVTTSAEYPYQAVQGSCNKTRKSRAGSIKEWKQYSPAKSENDLKDELVNKSPLGAQFPVANEWHDYKGGNVFTGPCGSLQHAMAIVGYGNQDGKDYWIMKNSWGKDWGDQGFMKLERGVNKCGIRNWVYYANS